MLRIQELEAEICQKEQDLILAGEIGSRILEEKIQLENSLKVFTFKIQELQNVIQELELVLQEKEQENCNLRISYKNLDKDFKENHKIVATLKAQLEISLVETEKFKNSKTLLETSLKEIQNLYEKLKLELKLKGSDQNDISLKCTQLSLHVQQVSAAKEEISLKLKSAVSENECLKLENQNQKRHIDQLREKLEILEFELQHLKESLQLRSKEDNTLNEKVDFSFGSSLLGEIDEKRILAETEAKESNEKHQGLLKNYNLIERQKERMKNHISRLTQLSQKQSAEHRLLILEGELSQALSENQNLKEKLLSFKHSRSSSEDSGDLEEKSLVSNILQENNRLNQEIKTLHMLKLNEADKVRSAYSLLHVKEVELDGLRSKFAQVKFELDEALLKLHNPDLIQQDLGDADSLLENDLELDSPERNSRESSEAEQSMKSNLEPDNRDSSFHSSAVSDNQIQQAMQSLSGMSTPSSDTSGPDVPIVQEESLLQSQNLTQHSSRNIKVDRAKIGQECNQQ